ncbi:MAG: hypothetical protein WCC36_08035 [Gammaproteobacteria bacterium]
MNQAGSNHQPGHTEPADCDSRGTDYPVDEHGVPILYEVVAPERWHELDSAAVDAGGEPPADIVLQLETLLRARVEAAVDEALQHAMEQALRTAERRLRDDLHSQLHHALPALIAEVLQRRAGH